MYTMVYILSFLVMSLSPKKILNKNIYKNVNRQVTETKYARHVLYEERITIIMDFLGISQEAAAFIYHRKRYGSPFKKSDDPKYMEWTLRLQNALVKADECVDWDWDEIKFGLEEQALIQNGIMIEDQSDTNIFKLEKKGKRESNSDGEWIIVKDIRKIRQKQNKILQIMGFIQKQSRYNNKKIKYIEKEKNENPPNHPTNTSRIHPS
jgi:hypothetical protein